GARRLRRHPECVFELRYGLRANGADGWITAGWLAIRRPPEDGGLFHAIQNFKREKKEDRLTTTARTLILALSIAGTTIAAFAQSPSSSSAIANEAQAESHAAKIAALDEESPVAQVRNRRSWEYAPFINFGNGIGGDRSNYRILSLGVEAGKVLTPPLHAGILSGQFQLAVNIMPFWQAYTPAPHIQTFVFQGVTYRQPVGGGTYTGASITPVIFRWNFLTRSKRMQP